MFLPPARDVAPGPSHSEAEGRLSQASFGISSSAVPRATHGCLFLLAGGPPLQLSTAQHVGVALACALN